MSKYDVFISYRCDGREALACLISERLKRREISVFYDVESLRTGKFNEENYQIIDGCTDVIVLLSSKGLDSWSNDDDWVRKEVSYAIKQEKNIIPIMISDSELPPELPADIEDLRNCQGISADMECFESAFEKLMSMLNSSKVIPYERIKQLTVDEALQNEFAKCIENVRNNNSAEAKYELAECYRKLANDDYNKEMIKLYSQAAQSGYAEAQNALGLCYEEGIGVEKNIEKAIELYKISSAKGYSSAQYRLANCYYSNSGVLYETYLKRAADQNYKDALCDLADYYVEKEDYSLAKTYYEKAAEAGCKEAKKQFKGIYKRLLWWLRFRKDPICEIIGGVFTGISAIGGILLIILLIMIRVAS